MSELCQQKLKEVLSYNPDTGIFLWLIDRPRASAGAEAGYITGNGYMRVQIARKSYALHRLVFLYTYGAMPSDEVDHINRNRQDNRLVNLRLVTKRQNLRNKSAYRNSALGLVGVCQRGSRFRAYINREGKRVNLGTFDTSEQASQAYFDAKRLLHPEYHECPR